MRVFEMSEEDLEVLKKASEPVPYMVFGGREPSSPQENANRAWKNLGDKLGFDHMTVKPGNSIRFFTAEEKFKLRAEVERYRVYCF